MKNRLKLGWRNDAHLKSGLVKERMSVYLTVRMCVWVKKKSD